MRCLNRWSDTLNNRSTKTASTRPRSNTISCLNRANRNFPYLPYRRIFMQEQTNLERAPRARLDGQVAVIAGGTGAIGRASAKRFAALGAHVVLLHRGKEAAAGDFLATLPGGHAQVIASSPDSAQLKSAAESVRARFGRTDILINSAGFTKPVPAADLDALT